MRLLFKVLFVCVLMSSNCVFSIDQSRIVEFFNDYSINNTKSLDRLSFAVETEYADVAEFLVANGEPVKSYFIVLDKVNNNRFTNSFIKHPLITAIKNGNINLSVSMIRTIENINSINEFKLMYFQTRNNGWSRFDIEKVEPLQAAIESPVGYPIIKELIAKGVNLNARYHVSNSSLKSTGFTPLILSVSNKKLDMTKLLLENGADPNLCFQWLHNNAPPASSPLYVAVDENYKEAIDLLLSYGADPLKKTSNNDLSPIELAINKGYLDIVELFLNTMKH